MVYKKEFKKKETVKQKEAREKEERAAKALESNRAAEAKRQADRNATAQSKANKEREKQAQVSQYNNERKISWNASINAIVSDVLRLRDDNPNRNGINAGKNGGLATIDGGSENPLQLNMPQPQGAATKGAIIKNMGGMKDSDSGYFKFDRKGVFVHCK